MTWPVSTDPQDSDALKWFLEKVPVVKEVWDAMSQDARRKAFTVAGVAHADILTQVHQAIAKALKDGTALGQFKKDIRTKLMSAWGEQVANPAWRIETIFRTNMQSAYSAGRWKQLNHPTIRKVRPYMMFDAVMDNRVSSICEKLDGTVLPTEEFASRGWVPPLHFNAITSDTKILSWVGEKPAGEMRVGDFVLTHQGRWRRVTAVMHKVSRKVIKSLHLASGRILRVTDEHPILVSTTSGLFWRQAGDLKIGDQVFEHRNKAGGAPDVAVPNPNNAPTLSDEPSISSEVVGTSGLCPMVLAVDFDGNLVFNESNIKNIRSYIVLSGGSREQGEDILLRWGEFALERFCHASGSQIPSLLVSHGVVGDHSFGNSGPLEPPRPMFSTASLLNHLRQSVGDCYLAGPASSCNPVPFAPTLDNGLPDADISLNSSEALPPLPVLSLDQIVNGHSVSQVDWHLSTVITIVEDTSFLGHLCDISVDEDESYVAGNVVVHNCRSALRSLRKSQAEKQERFGEEPPGVQAQDGFGQPLSEWKPDLGKYPETIRKQLEERLAKAGELGPAEMPTGT